MTGDAEDAQRASAQPERHHRGVHIVVLREHGEAQHPAIGVDLDHLLAGQPTQDVEVVDGEVAEDPARYRDVRLVRRGRVVAGHPGGVHRPQLTALDQPAHLAVGRVEPSLEP